MAVAAGAAAGGGPTFKDPDGPKKARGGARHNTNNSAPRAQPIKAECLPPADLFASFPPQKTPGKGRKAEDADVIVISGSDDDDVPLARKKKPKKQKRVVLSDDDDEEDDEDMPLAEKKRKRKLKKSKKAGEEVWGDGDADVAGAAAPDKKMKGADGQAAPAPDPRIQRQTKAIWDLIDGMADATRVRARAHPPYPTSDPSQPAGYPNLLLRPVLSYPSTLPVSEAIKSTPPAPSRALLPNPDRAPHTHAARPQGHVRAQRPVRVRRAVGAESAHRGRFALRPARGVRHLREPDARVRAQQPPGGVCYPTACYPRLPTMHPDHALQQ